MKLEAAEIIDRCSFFARVDPAGRQRLHDMARLRHFERGQTIFRQDDPCPGVYVVGSGLARVYKLAPSGKEHVLHLAGPGQTIAEVAAIMDTPLPAGAEALEDTTLALLPADRFMGALRQDHQLCLQLLGGMALRVRQFVGLLEDLVLRDALSRVARYFLNVREEQGDRIQLPALKKHLASHLNLTSETLSRCLRQLTDGGLIEPGPGQTLRILDARQLQSIAEGLFPTL